MKCSRDEDDHLQWTLQPLLLLDACLSIEVRVMALLVQFHVIVPTSQHNIMVCKILTTCLIES